MFGGTGRRKFASMQSTLCLPPVGSPEPDSVPAFNVVIVYEDFETGKQAKRTYDFLAANLGHECQFSNQMWKFDVLALPKLREMAANDATLADIVLIACRGGDLPVAVKSWFEAWLAEEHRPAALVALLEDSSEPNDPATPRLRAYLADVAKRGEMEFFSYPDQWPGRTALENHARFRRGAPNLPTTSGLASAAVDRDQLFAFWRINERCGDGIDDSGGRDWPYASVPA